MYKVSAAFFLLQNYFWLGVLNVCASAAAGVAVVTHANSLHLAWALFTACEYLLIEFAAVFAFGERLSTMQIGGLSLIFVSVILLALIENGTFDAASADADEESSTTGVGGMNMARSPQGKNSDFVTTAQGRAAIARCREALNRARQVLNTFFFKVNIYLTSHDHFMFITLFPQIIVPSSS